MRRLHIGVRQAVRRPLHAGGGRAIAATMLVVQGTPVLDTSFALLFLNRATPADLEGLPRIGPALARRIVGYRAEHGPFKRVEDLKNVKGVGEKTLERLRPLVKVGE